MKDMEIKGLDVRQLDLSGLKIRAGELRRPIVQLCVLYILNAITVLLFIFTGMPRSWSFFSLGLVALAAIFPIISWRKHEAIRKITGSHSLSISERSDCLCKLTDEEWDKLRELENHTRKEILRMFISADHIISVRHQRSLHRLVGKMSRSIQLWHIKFPDVTPLLVQFLELRQELIETAEERERRYHALRAPADNPPS